MYKLSQKIETWRQYYCFVPGRQQFQKKSKEYKEMQRIDRAVNRQMECIWRTSNSTKEINWNLSSYKFSFK